MQTDAFQPAEHPILPMSDDPPPSHSHRPEEPLGPPPVATTGSRAQVITTILGGLSLHQASNRMGGSPLPETVRRLRNGWGAREETIRDLARHFWHELCRHYGDDIRLCFGECTERAATDWLAALWGYPP